MFGPSLTSDLTLVLPVFGQPDLASELPLVPRVQKIVYNIECRKTTDVLLQKMHMLFV